MTKLLCAITFALLLLTPLSASAHHAFASEYDENKRVRVLGTVTEFKWTNPHAWLTVDQRDESGKVTKWNFEMGSPNGLSTRGWKKTDVKVGDQIVVEGYGAKDGSNVANAHSVTLPDGRKVFAGSTGAEGGPPK